MIVTRHYAPEPTGSAPPMRELAEWLAGHGHAATVVTSRPSYPHGVVTTGYAGGERDDVVEDGVRVLRWPTTPVRPGSLIARFVPELRFMLQLLAARVLGRITPSPTVVSLCPSILTVIGARFLMRRGGRHVTVVHDIQSGLGATLGTRLVRTLMAALRRLETWALNRTDHVIVLSDAMAAALRDQGVRTPASVLPVQVDCSTITPLPLPPGRPVLMYSGNLGRKQGLEQILDLAGELQRRDRPCQIVIRGDGAMRSVIAERIRRDRLANVSLEPLVSVERLNAALAEATLHLVPQIADGGDFAVPSKVFSIMAAGRTFIATAEASSTLAQLAASSDAFVCTPQYDAGSFATVVETLLDDPARVMRLAANGRRYVETHVDTDVVMRIVERLIWPMDETRMSDRSSSRWDSVAARGFEANPAPDAS